MTKILVYKKPQILCVLFLFLYEDELNDYETEEQEADLFYNYRGSLRFCLSKRILKDFKIMGSQCCISFVNVSAASFEEYMEFYSIAIIEYLNIIDLFDFILFDW